MNNRSISNLLFKRNVTAVFLCLAVTAIILCMVNINQTDKNRIESAKNLLTTQQSSFDISFDMVTSVVYQLSQDKIFYDYMSDSKNITYDMLELQKALTLRLSAIESSCYSAGIVKDGNSFVVSNRETGRLDKYLASIYVSPDVYYEFINDTVQSSAYHFIESLTPDSPYITLGARLSYNGHNSVCVLLTFYKEYFYQSFEEYNRFIMVSENKSVLDNRFNEEPKQLDEMLSVLNMPMTKRTNISSTKLGGTTYITAPSSSIDCWYVLAVSEPITLLLVNLIFILAAICIIALIIITIRNTVYLTRPIDSTADKLRSFATDTEYGQDGISLISNAADNIINENISLASKLNSRTSTLRTHFITDILSGVLLHDEIERGVEEFPVPDKDLTVAMLEFDDYDNQGLIGIEELVSISDNIRQQLNLSATIIEIIRFKSKYVLLLPLTDKKTIYELFELLVQTIENNYDLKLTAAIGTPVHTPYEWKDSFNIALNLLENKYTLTNRKILTPDNLARLKKGILYYPLDIEQLLINNIISTERTKVKLLLNDIIEKNFQSNGSLPEQILDLNQSVVHTINRVLQKVNADISDVFEEGTIIYLELKMCKNAHELKEKLTSLLDTVMNYISDSTNHGSKLTAESFTNYISQNYQLDISLTDVADFYGLSVPHTSKTIKQVTGQTFKEYLNFYRIQMAKKLFEEEENIKISDAAHKVGFINVNSFIRVFKTIEGTSPGSFKKNN